MASQITDNSNVGSTAYSGYENIKAPTSLSPCEGKPLLTSGFPYQRASDDIINSHIDVCLCVRFLCVYVVCVKLMAI